MSLSQFRRSVKNTVCGFSDAQVKVRDATSSDPSEPPESLMYEIARLTYDRQERTAVMNMLRIRLNDHPKNHVHIYKALKLLEYLVRNGPAAIMGWCKTSVEDIEMLSHFRYNEGGIDQGSRIRSVAGRLLTLISPPQHSFVASHNHVAQRTTVVVHTDFVSPQTEEEEDLQMQVALAMSREQTELEQVRCRLEDVQIAMVTAQSLGQFGVRNADHVCLDPFDPWDIPGHSDQVSAPVLGITGPSQPAVAMAASFDDLRDSLDAGYSECAKDQVQASRVQDAPPITQGSSQPGHSKQVLVPVLGMPGLVVPMAATFDDLRDSLGASYSECAKDQVQASRIRDAPPITQGSSQPTESENLARNFLGQYSHLVDLENLVIARPACVASTNPFAADMTNPFL